MKLSGANWKIEKRGICSSTFKSHQTNKSYTGFHEVNCSRADVIYLIECTLSKKQYVRNPQLALISGSVTIKKMLRILMLY